MYGHQTPQRQVPYAEHPRRVRSTESVQWGKKVMDALFLTNFLVHLGTRKEAFWTHPEPDSFNRHSKTGVTSRPRPRSPTFAPSSRRPPYFIRVYVYFFKPSASVTEDFQLFSQSLCDTSVSQAGRAFDCEVAILLTQPRLSRTTLFCVHPRSVPRASRFKTIHACAKQESE